jgi:hypothetical protein
LHTLIHIYILYNNTAKLSSGYVRTQLNALIPLIKKSSRRQRPIKNKPLIQIAGMGKHRNKDKSIQESSYPINFKPQTLIRKINLIPS